MPKDLASDDKTPRSAQIPSETETNLTIDNKTPRFDEMPKDLAIDGKLVQSKVKTKKNLTTGNKMPNTDEKQTNLTSDDKTPRADKVPSETETNLTIDNKTPRFDEMPKDLAIDDKLVQSKVKTKKNLTSGNKLPKNEEKQPNLMSDDKTPRSDKMQRKSKNETNLTSVNQTLNNDKIQKDLTSDGKMLRSAKRTSKKEKNLKNGNNSPNNDKMQNDGTELLDEFKALLKSNEYKTEGANILIDWLLEKECKLSKNMNKNSEKLEVTDGKNEAELEKFYEIYSKICAENVDKKAILAEYQEQLTQMKDTLITQLLAQMKKCEQNIKKNGPNAKQYAALLKFGDDFKAFLDEMPEMEGKNAIVALLAPPILPSELLKQLLITNKMNSTNLNTKNAQRRHARSGRQLRIMKSDEFKTEDNKLLVEWALEMGCKIINKNLNENAKICEENEEQCPAQIKNYYTIMIKICIKNGDKNVILAEHRKQLTQLKDILGTQILAQMKKHEQNLQKNGPNAKQYLALLKFGDDFKAFLDEMPEMEGKNAIVALLSSNPSSPIMPSDLIQLMLITNKINSKNLITVNRRGRRDLRDSIIKFIIALIIWFIIFLWWIRLSFLAGLVTGFLLAIWLGRKF
ncbi:hypothetical protein niasHT_010871 [Heterodera trifolii]|uniref:Uncharacterized protein n=1 Tax=Heterodera trifolii TaxID=157864 RepID=A0ABD2LCZ9_9BILA